MHDWIYILCYNAFVDMTTFLLVIHCDFCLFILFTLQTHPCNENRVFPVKFFSQASVVVGLGYDLLFKSILGHCVWLWTHKK